MGERHGILFAQFDRHWVAFFNGTEDLLGPGIAGHPHSQPNPRYRCFLPDLTEFTRFVIERDPAIASRRKGSLAERVGFEPTVR